MALQQIKGVGTIVYGAGGILGAPAGAIVDSLQLTPKNAEPIDIEGNDATTAFQVLLRDGFNGKASCIYDATKTWPIEGVNCGLTIPYTGAGANAVPFGEGNGANYNANTVTYTCWVVSVSPAYKKKGEAMIDINVTYRPNVNV